MSRATWVLGGCALVVSVLLCEILLSLFNPQIRSRPPTVWQFDPELGWAHVPGGQGRLVTPEFDVGLSINSDGLRGDESSRERRPGVRRILLFGDSFAEGWGVEEEQALSARLADCLSQGNETVEVLNFGVAGYGTDQAFLLYQKLGRLYDPDLVVALFYGNDLWNNASPRGIGAEQGYKPYFRPLEGGRLSLQGVPVRKTRYWDMSRYEGGSVGQRAVRYLRSNWHLYALVEKAATARDSASPQSQFYDGLYGVDTKGKWQPLWDLTGFLLRDFATAVGRDGSEFVLVYAPSIVQVEPDNWREKSDLHGLTGDYDMLNPNRQLSEIAQRYGLTLVDPYPAFKEAGRRDVLYLRDSHWNARGHSIAAEVLCGHLQPAGGETP